MPELQQLPELDLPVNGLARMEAIQTDLKHREKRSRRRQNYQGVELPVDGVTDLHTLIKNQTLENELEQAELQLMSPGNGIPRFKSVYGNRNQIASAEAQIEGLGLGKLSFADLIVRKQWLEALRPQSSDQKPCRLRSKALPKFCRLWLACHRMAFLYSQC